MLKHSKKFLVLFLTLSLILSNFYSIACFAEENKAVGSVIVSVEKFTIGQGFCIEPMEVPFYEGEFVGNVVSRVLGDGKYNNATSSTNISYLKNVYNDKTIAVDLPSYLKDRGIDTTLNVDDWLGEGDFSSTSGWMYTVNNALPSMYMSEVRCMDGDVIRLQFSVCGYGADIGYGFDTSYIEPANKDELIKSVAQINSKADKSILLSNQDVKDSYDTAVMGIEFLKNDQETVDFCTSDLKEKIDNYYNNRIDVSLSTIASDYSKSAYEWAIMNMVAYGKINELTPSDVSKYIEDANKIAFTSTTVTDLAKVSIILTSLGKNPCEIKNDKEETCNLIEKISNSEKMGGINSATFALLAYDCNDFEVENKKWGRKELVQYIQDNQHNDGGWSLSEDKTKVSDPDITSMVLSSIALYYDKTEYGIKDNIDKAVLFLSGIQNADGTFSSYNTKNSNSISTVITALSALGINPQTDSRFVKNNISLIDALFSFETTEHKFGYTNNTKSNKFATQQAFQALISYKNFISQNKAYNIYIFNNSKKVNVSVRIEGISENKLFLDNKRISYDTENLTVADVIKTVVDKENYVMEDGSYGSYFKSLFKEEANTFNKDYDGWQYRVNSISPSVSVSEYNVKNGDEILVYYGGASIAYPKAPKIQYNDQNGEVVLTFVTDEISYGGAPDYEMTVTQVPIKNAQITWGYDSSTETFQTNDNGTITIPYEKAKTGDHSLQIAKYDTTAVNEKYLPLVVRYNNNHKLSLNNNYSPSTGGGGSGGGGGGGGGSTNITVSFKLVGDSKHSTPDKHSKAETWIEKKNYNIAKNSTVKDLFEKALKGENIPYVISGGSYVTSINGLKEFDNGPNSGWKYTINSNGTTESMTEYILKSGDDIVWSYTDDYTKDNDFGSSGSGSGSGSGSSNTNKTQDIKNPYKDLDNNHWAKEYILFLTQKKLIEPKSDGMFAPDEMMTRGELIKILYKVSKDKIQNCNFSFIDVSKEDKYASAICWGVENKIINGITDKIFAPNDNITREQTATMLMRFCKYMKLELPTTNTATPFKDDENIFEYAKDSVKTMQMADIISGREDNMFVPKDNVSRAETAKMVTLIVKLLK